jgi:pimeloyl-ACP methyl ester carboxylesterase
VSAPGTAVTVRGGSDSIAADFEQLAAFATALDGATGPVTRALRLLARCLTEPAMIRAGMLDPAGGAWIVALAGVTTAGAAAALAGCQSIAAGLRLAAGSYRAADDLDRRLAPVLAAGLRLPLVLAPLTGVPRRGGSSGLQARLTADPQLADLAVGLATIAGTRGLPLPAAMAGWAGLLANRFRDGTPVLSVRPGLPTGDCAGPPRGAADLIRALALRGAHNDGGGAVDVRILDGPAGRRVIVDITGTTVWNLDPRRRTPQVSDLGSNLRALANRPSVFERGVLLALRQAGVRPGEPIMLVGHSQGGMVAARLAGQLRTEAGLTVTHLVTAGSPLGLAPVPGSVSVLSLQNTGDLVPELDGADNPRRGNWITVRTARGDSSVLGKHSVQAYLAGAGDLDASTDGSLVQWRRSAAGFLTADRVSTQVFEIRRGP